MKNIRTIIADDHEIFLDGLKLMLQKQPGITIVGEASNGIELVEMVKNTEVDIVLTDIGMPKMDGIEATLKISAIKPNVGIIGLSMHDEENIVIDLLEAGARGYLLKNADKQEIIDAINTVYEQEPYYCKSISAKMIKKIARSRFNPYQTLPKPEFSDREKEIIGLICRELTNKEMAEHLLLSTRTIEGYRFRILEKMQVKNTVGLVVYAMRNKLYLP